MAPWPRQRRTARLPGPANVNKLKLGLRRPRLVEPEPATIRTVSPLNWPTVESAWWITRPRSIFLSSVGRRCELPTKRRFAECPAPPLRDGAPN